jgi:hypothetical protein
MCWFVYLISTSSHMCIVTFLWLSVYHAIVTLVCIPTEDGWERETTIMHLDAKAL